MKKQLPVGTALGVLLILLTTFLGYRTAMSGTAFALDDIPVIVENDHVRADSPPDILEILSSSYWGTTNTQDKLWRPLPIVTFALDAWLWGKDADRFRMTSVALHALASILLWILILQLLELFGVSRKEGEANPTSHRVWATIGACVFALHPIHAEAVAGLVGRSEVLACLGVLGGLVLHFRGRRTGTRALYLLSGLCFFFGYLSKESALTAPVLLFLIEWAIARRGDTALSIRVHAMHGVLLLTYFTLRFVILGGLTPEGDAKILAGYSLFERLSQGALATTGYVSDLFWPTGTSAYYPVDETNTWLSRLPLLLHAAVVAWGVTLLLRKRGAMQLLGLGVVGFYVSLLPVSNLIPIGVVRADRLAYIPSVFWTIALTVVGLRLIRGPMVSAATGVALSVPLAVVLASTARAWSDPVELWEHSTERFPDQGRCHLFLGREMVQRSQFDAGLLSLRKALEMGLPEGSRLEAMAYGLTGVSLQALGRTEDAWQALTRCLTICPEELSGLIGMCRLHLGRGPAGLEQAGDLARKATEQHPLSYEAWLVRGTVLLASPEADLLAREVLSHALTLRPEPWEAHHNRSIASIRLGDLSSALDDSAAVIRILGSRILNPESERVFCRSLLNRAGILLKQRRVQEAIQDLQVLEKDFPHFRTEEVTRLLDLFRRAG